MGSRERFPDRSDVRFFHDESTHRAMKGLADSSRLVVYCGAGVTIERTGLDWLELIGRVFSSHPHLRANDRFPSDQEIKYLIKNESGPAVASILSQYMLDALGEDDDGFDAMLGPTLRNYLYRERGWHVGRLATRVAHLALAAAAVRNIDVDIVTTNYETYVEKAVLRAGDVTKAALLEPDAGGTPAGTVADDTGHVVVTVSGIDEPVRQNGWPSPQAGSIRIHYLHGRVAEDGTVSGRLVLSERDYADTHEVTVREQMQLFGGNGTGVLLVGASLRDVPLVDALARTRSRGGARVALVPVESTGYTQIDQPPDQMAAHVRKRGEFLGTDILLPDFKFQVAQFVAELEDCVTRESDEKWIHDQGDRRYGRRLTRWWNAWQASHRQRTAHEWHKELATQAGALRDLIDNVAPTDTGDERERFRLELWLRDNPESERRLSRWATSSTTEHEPAEFHRAPLERGSRCASVRAFVEGRPQHHSVDDLLGSITRPDDARWRSFLSVPIDVQVTADSKPVPVGVMTLASNRRTTVDESVQTRSSLPLGTKHMAALVAELLDKGRSNLAIPVD